MRKLTVKRNKSFVGCLNKAKIYIEDSASKELIINNVPCKKLGDLKNNEKKTFEIGNEEAKVFVVSDKIFKNISNDCYQLYRGEEDVFLSGQNRFNISTGNAFEFDNGNLTVLPNGRKKKSMLPILIVSIIIGAIVGFAVSYSFNSDKKVEPKDFQYDGLNITLTNEFTEVDAEGRTVCYDSKRVAVLVLKEEFSLAEGFGDLTLEEYADILKKENDMSSSKLKETDGLLCFEYDYNNAEVNKTFRYFSYLYKSDDAFWVVQFATQTEYVEELSPKINEWAKSVSFCYCFD